LLLYPLRNEKFYIKIEEFETERLQSTWENRVKYNLSKNGVHPLLLKELTNKDELG